MKARAGKEAAIKLRNWNVTLRGRIDAPADSGDDEEVVEMSGVAVFPELVLGEMGQGQDGDSVPGIARQHPGNSVRHRANPQPNWCGLVDLTFGITSLTLADVQRES